MHSNTLEIAVNLSVSLSHSLSLPLLTPHASQSWVYMNPFFLKQTEFMWFLQKCQYALAQAGYTIYKKRICGMVKKGAYSLRSNTCDKEPGEMHGYYYAVEHGI